MSDDTIVIDTPEGIEAFRRLALRSALKLEILGMRRSHGSSALTILRESYGIKARTKKAALIEWEERLRQDGILQ
jgi:hypothetical protein